MWPIWLKDQLLGQGDLSNVVKSLICASIETLHTERFPLGPEQEEVESRVFFSKRV